jgi:hypothetical protein
VRSLWNGVVGSKIFPVRKRGLGVKIVCKFCGDLWSGEIHACRDGGVVMRESMRSFCRDQHDARPTHYCEMCGEYWSGYHGCVRQKQYEAEVVELERMYGVGPEC